MSNDLISRSALKKAINTYDKFACLPNGKLEPIRNLEHPEMFEEYVHFRDIIKCIDNAPTVNKPNVITIPHDLIEKLVLCVVDTVETIPWSEAIEAYKSKPRGYWLNKQKDGWNCSECGEWSRSTDDFCKGCGADMREVKDEQTN